MISKGFNSILKYFNKKELTALVFVSPNYAETDTEPHWGFFHIPATNFLFFIDWKGPKRGLHLVTKKNWRKYFHKKGQYKIYIDRNGAPTVNCFIRRDEQDQIVDVLSNRSDLYSQLNEEFGHEHWTHWCDSYYKQEEGMDGKRQYSTGWEDSFPYHITCNNEKVRENPYVTIKNMPVYKYTISSAISYIFQHRKKKYILFNKL